MNSFETSKAENNAKTPKPRVEKEVKKERNKFTPKEKEAKTSIEQNSSGTCRINLGK